MLDGKTILGVIPARGGSKGVPRKNIRELSGKPLIAWTIEAANRSKYLDRVILSSEDEEIIATAKTWGCEVPFVRPTELSQDETPGTDPILHALQELPGYDIVVVLQPTSPLRTTADIDAGLEFFVQQGALACVAVSEVSKSPYWMFSLDGQNRLQRLLTQDAMATRRQDLPATYMPNGALFMAQIAYFQARQSFYTVDTIGYVMPQEQAYDIDEEMDFVMCEALKSNDNVSI